MTITNFKRNLSYIKENLIIMLKTLVEYKVSFWMMFVDGFVWGISQFILIFVVCENFGNLINWKLEDFVLLIILVNILWSFIGIFNWGQVLFKIVKKGELNSLLVRPMQMWVKFYFYNLEETAISFFILTIIYSIFLFLYFNIKLYNLFLGSIILFFCCLSFLFFWLAIDSFNLLKNGSSNLFSSIYLLDENFGFYPSQFFSKSRIKVFFNLLPLYFVSSLLIPILRNHKTSGLLIQFLLLLFILLVEVLVLVFNWYYGLKRYDGYG